MARPLMKDTLIRFRVTTNLKEMIRKEAKNSGLSISEWIIKVIKEKLRID